MKSCIWASYFLSWGIYTDPDSLPQSENWLSLWVHSTRRSWSFSVVIPFSGILKVFLFVCFYISLSNSNSNSPLFLWKNLYGLVLNVLTDGTKFNEPLEEFYIQSLKEIWDKNYKLLDSSLSPFLNTCKYILWIRINTTV